MKKTIQPFTREQFDVTFVFNKQTSEVEVYRHSGKDKLCEFIVDDIRTQTEFEDVCTCWCDQNAA